jgi:hypothetical protein
MHIIYVAKCINTVVLSFYLGITQLGHVEEKHDCVVFLTSFDILLNEQTMMDLIFGGPKSMATRPKMVMANDSMCIKQIWEYKLKYLGHKLAP